MIAQKKAAGALATPTTAIIRNSLPLYRASTDPVTAFQAAMLSAGMEQPREVIPDGKIHRFSTTGKRGGDSGWYVLHLNGLCAGAYGDWRTGASYGWSASSQCNLSPVERAALAQRYRAMELARDREQRARHEQVAHAAVVRWKAGLPVIGQGHPYLQAKSVQAHGLRLEGGGHTMLVPMRDSAGKLWGLQSIYPDGAKRFMPGQRVQGCYHAIGKLGEKVALCEGYATGATLHEVTGQSVAVAFNAGNLLAAARVLRGKYPELDMVVCADDDWQTSGNPGLSKAKEAAAAIGARLAVPDFTGLPRGAKDTDFNDLNRLDRLAGKGVRHD